MRLGILWAGIQKGTSRSSLSAPRCQGPQLGRLRGWDSDLMAGGGIIICLAPGLESLNIWTAGWTTSQDISV